MAKSIQLSKNLEWEKPRIEKKETKVEILEISLNSKSSEEQSVQKEINIFNEILDRISDSKVHGIGNIVKAKSSILRIIWVLCLLASTTLCVYELVTAILVYYQFGVKQITTIKYEAPSKFPSIDVCNVIPYDAADSEVITLVASIVSSNNFTSGQFANPKDYTDQILTLIKANSAKLSINGNFNQFENSYNLEDMMISCFFEGIACNLSRFYYYNDFNYGNCFSFNNNQVNNAGHGNTTNSSILTSSFSGFSKGFQLEMYTGSPANQIYSYSNGLRVTVHNQTTIVFPFDDGLNVPNGMQTNLIVKRTFFSHLNAPYSNCLTDPVDYTQNTILKVMASNYSMGTAVYKQSYCLKVCLQQHIVSICGCYDMSFPSLISNDSILRGCYEQADLTCINSAYLQYIAIDHDIYCYAQCPLECTEIIIDLEHSYSNYPTSWYTSLMLNNTDFLAMVAKTAPLNFTPNEKFLQSNTLLLNVFYDRLGYVEIIEEPSMTIDSLFAIFGGNLGLFLG